VCCVAGLSVGNSYGHTAQRCVLCVGNSYGPHTTHRHTQHTDTVHTQTLAPPTTHTQQTLTWLPLCVARLCQHINAHTRMSVCVCVLCCVAKALCVVCFLCCVFVGALPSFVCALRCVVCAKFYCVLQKLCVLCCVCAKQKSLPSFEHGKLCCVCCMLSFVVCCSYAKL